MRRKYGDCQRRDDGNCTLCPLASKGADCHGRPITKLEWARLAARLTQKQLAEASGIGLRMVQKVEGREVEAGKMEARNLLALAKVLKVDPNSLI